MTISVHIGVETRLVNVTIIRHGASVCRGLSIPRNLLRARKSAAVRVVDCARFAKRRARFRVVVRPFRFLHAGRGRTNERMAGREFHTKHNPHIETQTQWPRQVGRGAVLPARARVRELYPRVRVYDYEMPTHRDVRMEKERKSEEERWSRVDVRARTHDRAMYLRYYVN